MGSEAEDLSARLAAAVEAAAPSVWRVEGRRGASGVAWSEDRLITVAVAVAGLAEVRAIGPDGAARRARVVGVDLSADLALLEVEGGGLRPAVWADTGGQAAPRVGSLTLALGRPAGSVEAAWGIVRATGGAWETQGGAQVDAWIDVDGGLPRGFPGGPLVDAAGRFLGLNSRWIAPGGSTLPAATLRRLVEDLARGGRPGRLGVAVQPVEVDGGGAGLMVMRVDPGSPAAAAGIFQGDVLLEIGGVRLRQPATLQGWLRAGRAGASAEAVIRRGGAELRLPVTVGERPEHEAKGEGRGAEAGPHGRGHRHGCGSRCG